MRARDLKDKTLDELEQIVVGLGQKKYLAGYIFHFIHAKDATEIPQMTPLSTAFRDQLVQQGYSISRLTTLGKQTDNDGTVKYVFGLGNGERIETVLLSSLATARSGCSSSSKSAMTTPNGASPAV